ncbi:MAG: ABC-F family ATP-binding cassette domain-containing protein [Pseudomonadota bacterium]
MLRIHDLVFDAWGRRFFDHATVSLPVGAKVGLVGRNGAGKSTLFRLIQGELSAGGGEIDLPRIARIGSVDQEHPATPVPLLDTVLAADVERARLTGDLETAPPERLADIYARLADIDADRAPSRAAEILGGLGFSTADLTRPMAEFSGGWRMRVAMAAALFAQPDLLLLDEPTNYLDLEGALWLEARLRKYPRTALIISHDRELLDHSVDAILHLTEGRLDFYAGNFSQFERQRAERFRLQAATRTKIEAKRAHMQAFVDRFGAKASKARQAQSRMKMIARLEAVAPAVEENVAPFLLPSPQRPLAPPLVRLEGVQVGYGGPPVLKGLNLRLDLDDRIGLLGVNGSGKTTFARMIAGDLASNGGHVHRDRRLKVGWFHQHQIEALDPDDTPLAIIRRALPEATESQRRSRLARFGMTVEKVETTVANLSGGERARLLLNMVAMERPHLLILDEPTNHLDIDSRRALTDALNDYSGAVILITHDRSLMELVADRLWLVADGTVKPFDGDMEDYARVVLERARAAARGPAKPVSAPVVAPRPATGALKRKLEEAETKLARESREAADLDAALEDPALYRGDTAGVAEITRRRARVAERLVQAEARWLEAAEVYEAVKADS